MNLDEQLKNTLLDPPVGQMPDEDWLKLSMALDRKEFYRFSFFRFNLYYALMIFASLVTTGIMIADYYQHKELGHAHVFVKPIDQKSTSSERVDVQDEVQEKVIVISESSSQEPETEVVLFTQPETHQVIKEKRTDTLVTDLSQLEVETLKEKPTVILVDTLPHKVVEIHHRDTIYTFDSVKVSRRKWRKMHE